MKPINVLLATSCLLLAHCAAGPKSGGDLLFHGEENLLEGFEYDSGYLPADLAAQARVVVRGGGRVEVDAVGVANDGVLSPVPGTGVLRLGGELTLEVFAKIDLAPLNYEGIVEEVGYSIPITMTTFDPFLVGGPPASLDTPLPMTELLRAPIPSVPGATIVLTLTGGTLTTEYEGDCATVEMGLAGYSGVVSLSGTLELSATIEVEIPLRGTETFGPIEFIAPVPVIERAIELGTYDLSSGMLVDDPAPLCSGITMDGGVPDGGVRDGGVPSLDGGPASDGGTPSRDAGAPSSDAGPAACGPGFGDCDGDATNGCETPLNTLSDCGGCGTSCDIANADVTCSSGTCAFGNCARGFGNCDGNLANGCELDHTVEGSTCDEGIGAGIYSGDRTCGFLCGDNTAWTNFRTYTGHTSQWFQAAIREGATVCDTDVEHRIRLIVPPGVDYDLFLYRADMCGEPFLSSRRPIGLDEEIIYRADDGPLRGGGTLPYYVEVRYYSGTSCTPFTLHFDGHSCN